MNRIFAIVLPVMIFLGVSGIESAAQTPTATSKEVLTDKSGRFVYSLARDANQELAFQLAYDDLMPKLERAGKSANIELLKKSIQRIDNEVFNIYRVILFVDMKNLNTSGAAPQVLPPADSKNDEIVEEVTATVVEEKTDTVVSATEVMTEVELPEASEEATEESPAEENEEITAETAEENENGEAISEESTASPLPSGRLGDLVSHIMEQPTIKGVQNQLEKAKSSMVVSQYGSGQSKYYKHAYVVTQENRKIVVYSPEDKEGKRMNYATGETVDSIGGIKLYWFLKR